MEHDKGYVQRLEKELSTYWNAAERYGITAPVMLELAKSQIKTCADNIRMMERLRDIYDTLFRWIPDELTEQDLMKAISQYDGDSSKPSCDTVYAALKILQELLRKREEAEEWLSKYAI